MSFTEENKTPNVPNNVAVHNVSNVQSTDVQEHASACKPPVEVTEVANESVTKSESDTPIVSQEPCESIEPDSDQKVTLPSNDVENPQEGVKSSEVLEEKPQIEDKPSEVLVEEQHVDANDEVKVEHSNEPSEKMDLDVKEEPVETAASQCHSISEDTKVEPTSQADEVKVEVGPGESHSESVSESTYASFYDGNDVCNEVEIGASEEVAVSSPDNSDDDEREIKDEKRNIEDGNGEKVSIKNELPKEPNNKNLKTDSSSSNIDTIDSRREGIKTMPPRTTAVADTAMNTTTTTISSRYVRIFSSVLNSC